MLFWVLVKKKLKRNKHFVEILKGSGTAFSVNVLTKIVGYAFTLIVTRKLGAEAWGFYALSFVIIQLASMFGRFGVDVALLRFVAEYRAKKQLPVLKDIYKKSMNIVVPLSLFVAISVFLLSPFLSNNIFNKPFLANYLRVASFIIVPFVIYTVHLQIIRGLKKIKEFMVLQLGTNVLSICLFLAGILILNSFFLPILAYGIAVLIMAVVSVFLWKRYFVRLIQEISLDSFTRFISYREILSVAIPLLLSSSLILIMSSTDTIMLGVFRTVKEIAIYNVALKLSMLTSIILSAVNTIAAPKFAEFFGKKDFSSLKETAYFSTKLIFWFSTPIVTILFLFPQKCLGLFGSDFKKGAIILIIMSAGQFINALTGSVGLILIMTGKHITHRNIVLVSAIGNFVLNFVLINKFGILGAALTTALTQAVGNLTAMFFVKKYYGFYTIAGIWK